MDAKTLDDLIGLRRDLHAHPELGFEEKRTSAIVAARLAEAGFEVTTGLGQTGVVGTLRKGDGNRAILLRADMDALAMHEETGLPYASKVDGRMHACGHDGHTVMLLGAAQQLASQDFSGTVHLVFQPAEEGRGGAAAMINDGLLDRFPVDAAYGVHNMPVWHWGRSPLSKARNWPLPIIGLSTFAALGVMGPSLIRAVMPSQLRRCF